MWMSDYIREIKRQFRDTYGFAPTGGTREEPTFAAIPDGEYPMTIDGRLDHVRIEDGRIRCGNFDETPIRPARRRKGTSSAIVVVLAVTMSAGAQDRNDMNDPPPLPAPTAKQLAGLRRLERLAVYLADHRNGTVERFVRRELSLPGTTRVDLPRLARCFAVSERDVQLLFYWPGGRDGIVRRIRRHLHWWGRYVDIHSRESD